MSSSVVPGNQQPVRPARSETVAIIVDEVHGSADHILAGERFAQLLVGRTSRVAIGSSGRTGTLSGRIVNAAVQSGLHVTCVVESSGISDAHSDVTLDTVCDTECPAEARHRRKQRLFDHGSQFIAMPGGVAVWEELLEVLSGAQLGRHEHSIGLLNAGGFYNPLLDLMSKTVKCGFTEPEVMTYMVSGATPEELLERLDNYAPTRVVKMIKPKPHQLSKPRASL